MTRKMKRMILIVMLVTIGVTAGVGFGKASNITLFPQTEPIREMFLFGKQVITAPLRGVSGTVKYMNELNTVHEENEFLKSFLSDYSILQSKNIQLKNENKRLEDMLGMVESLNDYDVMYGRVLMRNHSTWEQHIVINRGSEQGVKVGDSVMGPNGYIGRVTSVSKNQSQVELITSASSSMKVSVMLVDEKGNEVSQAYGVVEGYDINQGALALKYMDQSIDVKTGYKVVTSGLDGQPRGLYVGEVTGTKLGEFGNIEEILVTPAQNMADIFEVFVTKQ